MQARSLIETNFPAVDYILFIYASQNSSSTINHRQLQRNSKKGREAQT